MAQDIPLRCTCGSLQGVARGMSPTAGNRALCYCKSCQAFAFFLGRADEVLDEHGGSDIFQTTPSRIQITEGADQLRCMQLNDGGLYRWYTECCQTPVGNTMSSAQIPFIGLLSTIMDHDATGHSRDEDLGPIRDRVWASTARGDRTGLSGSDGFSYASLPRLFWMMLSNRIRGLHQPSPFFDVASGNPRATPHVLTVAELKEAETRRDATER
ncbi:MAG: hypothetical protein GY723_06555 [bacterium]|nr:hypothetical protein [bacterium]